MDCYYSLLPYIDNSDFKQEFVVVYDDWDVGDDFFRKILPSLCPLLFEIDVFS